MGWDRDVEGGQENRGDVMDWVKKCVQENREHDFYVSSAWQKAREEVLREYHYECQECKKRGKYTKAVIVHHVKHLKEFPELALSKTYIDTNGKERIQLKPVCKECHEYVEHPERLRWNKKKPLTEERW